MRTRVHHRAHRGHSEGKGEGDERKGDEMGEPRARLVLSKTVGEAPVDRYALWLVAAVARDEESFPATAEVIVLREGVSPSGWC